MTSKADWFEHQSLPALYIPLSKHSRGVHKRQATDISILHFIERQTAGMSNPKRRFIGHQRTLQFWKGGLGTYGDTGSYTNSDVPMLCMRGRNVGTDT